MVDWFVWDFALEKLTSSSQKKIKKTTTHPSTEFKPLGCVPKRCKLEAEHVGYSLRASPTPASSLAGVGRRVK